MSKMGHKRDSSKFKTLDSFLEDDGILEECEKKASSIVILMQAERIQQLEAAIAASLKCQTLGGMRSVLADILDAKP